MFYGVGTILNMIGYDECIINIIRDGMEVVLHKGRGVDWQLLAIACCFLTNYAASCGARPVSVVVDCCCIQFREIAIGKN